MQHFGVLTRLLDWTMSFACALYFAQRDRSRDDDAAIFILEPESTNAKVTGEDSSITMPLVLHEHHEIGPRHVDLDLYHPNVHVSTDEVDQVRELPSLNVVAPFGNPRMQAQRGVFTLCGSSFCPEFEGSVVKIELPASTYDDAEEFLALAGVNEFTYFPDLFGLSRLLEDVRTGIDRT